MRKFTHEMKKFIKDNATNTSNSKLTSMVNEKFETDFTVSQIKSFKQNNKISSGLTGRFEKGHVPVNKGAKGVYHEGSEKTWFQKGHTPSNHRPVGSERISKDGYVEIKTQEPNRWRLKHNVVWEEHNGKIPNKHVVIFLDGNKENVDISNLKLITRSELLLMNRQNLFSEDPEITNTASNIARLVVTRNKVNKKNKDKF